MGVTEAAASGVVVFEAEVTGVLLANTLSGEVIAFRGIDSERAGPLAGRIGGDASSFRADATTPSVLRTSTDADEAISADAVTTVVGVVLVEAVP